MMPAALAQAMQSLVRLSPHFYMYFVIFIFFFKALLKIQVSLLNLRSAAQLSPVLRLVLYSGCHTGETIFFGTPRRAGRVITLPGWS